MGYDEVYIILYYICFSRICYVYLLVYGINVYVC